MPAPVLFLPHGGGPLPLINDPAHAGLISFLTSLAQKFPRPDAVVLISAHWEARIPAINAAPSPPLLYDYQGFPPETYHIRYPAPGQPLLAQQIAGLLQAQGMASTLVTDRGFDHGVFVPMKLLYPAADIPCIQVSLIQGLDVAAHVQLGRALASLPERNIAIIGSGMSFHNLPALFATVQQQREASDSFDAWLTDTLTDGALSEKDRMHALENWQNVPHARFCHPRAEHLVPLFVCYGAAEGRGGIARLIFNDVLMGHKVSGFGWY